MKKLVCLFLLSTLIAACAPRSKQNQYGLKIVDSDKEYLELIHQDTNKALIEIKKAVPDIKLDIRYATRNNFMKQVMYKQARAFARRPVVEQLKIIQAELKKKGYGLKVFDAYRPYSITVEFFKRARDKNFVADPAKGSKHNRGCAVDLTLINLKTGKDLPMPTPYDSFEPAAAPHYSKLPPQLIKNRDFLIQTMQAHGFKVIYNEWWHFDFTGWPNYELMDIPFESL
jgi:D-alanyl-D-alanine dipeptidase